MQQWNLSYARQARHRSRRNENCTTPYTRRGQRDGSHPRHGGDEILREVVCGSLPQGVAHPIHVRTVKDGDLSLHFERGM